MDFLLILATIAAINLNVVKGAPDFNSIKIAPHVEYGGFALYSLKEFKKEEIVTIVPSSFCLWVDRGGRIDGLLGQTELTNEIADLRYPITSQIKEWTWDIQLSLALLDATAGTGLKSKFWDDSYTWLLPKPESLTIPFTRSIKDLQNTNNTFGYSSQVVEGALKQKQRLSKLFPETKYEINKRNSKIHRVLGLALQRVKKLSRQEEKKSVSDEMESKEIEVEEIEEVCSPLEWAFACVRSRVFHHAPSDSFALVPIIDSCNHSLDPNCKLEADFDSEFDGDENGDRVRVNNNNRDLRHNRSGFRLVALKPIQAGEELTISYGNYSNRRLLVQYGFTLPSDTATANDAHVDE